MALTRGLSLLISVFTWCPLVMAADGKSETQLEAGQSYQWTAPKRQGLEAWQYFVICVDAKAARAFTDDIVASIESFRDESGHSIGAHLDYVFPSHLPCHRKDGVAFTPLAEQPENSFETLGFAMVYLPAEQGEQATHRCAERPCAFAPVLRKFIRIRLQEGEQTGNAWLRVSHRVSVKAAEQE